MEIRVLNYYLTIAREGSLTAAANVLHITQPTLSRQIKELEAELGKKLFVRSNYKMLLTEEGQIFRKRAEDIMEMVNKTFLEFQAMEESEISGDIYIGAGETDKIEYIVQLIKKLHEIYPGIRYQFYTGNLPDIEEHLDRGLIDFGLVFQKFNADKYNYIVLPSTDRWGVLMRKDSPLAEKTKITPKDLIHLPLICSRQAADAEIANWFGNDFKYTDIFSTYDLLYNPSHLVRAGVGYAIALEGIIHTSGDSPLCFRPLSPSLKSNIILLWRKNAVFSKPASIFYNYLMQEFVREEDGIISR